MHAYEMSADRLFHACTFTSSFPCSIFAEILDFNESRIEFYMRAPQSDKFFT